MAMMLKVSVEGGPGYERIVSDIEIQELKPLGDQAALGVLVQRVLTENGFKNSTDEPCGVSCEISDIRNSRTLVINGVRMLMRSQLVNGFRRRLKQVFGQ